MAGHRYATRYATRSERVAEQPPTVEDPAVSENNPDGTEQATDAALSENGKDTDYKAESSGSGPEPKAILSEEASFQEPLPKRRRCKGVPAARKAGRGRSGKKANGPEATYQNPIIGATYQNPIIIDDSPSEESVDPVDALTTAATATDTRSPDDFIKCLLAYKVRYSNKEASNPIGEANGVAPKASGVASAYKDGFTWNNGIDEYLHPICTVKGVFEDIFEKIKPSLPQLIDVIQQKNGAVKVGTMCSGTDSPLVALNEIAKLCELNGMSFPIDHSFSAEIVPFKQAFLRLNFNPGQLYQNVCELIHLIMDKDGNHVELPREDIVGKETMTTAHGGKAVIPGDLDLLIAGTCCTDFSIMNSQRKTLTAGGESGDTFFSMIAYATYYRPKIIILENVQSAPWLKEKWKKKSEAQGFDNEFEKIQYATHFVLLDTKDYYIPHTRSRGYMIAIDIKDMSHEERTNVNELLKQWAVLVQKDLKRPASTPVEMWLKRADDPLLIHCRSHWVDDLEKPRKPPRWDACQVNYASYRQNLGLGEGRPVTSWGNDGYFQLPDFYQQKHNFGLTERVLDTMDVGHLRGLLRSYDDRYYFRVTELGQNVYRDKEQNKQGVVSCQTPNAQQFVSVRGSRISGQEALNLQGLPVDGLDTSRLSQAEMQNLSGNAMTTTVVGVVTMAALITFSSLLSLKGDRTEATSSQARIPSASCQEEFLPIDSSTWSHQSLPTSKALVLAMNTLRLCYCEHREQTKDVQFQQCITCLHTSCTSCGKKPTHEYKTIDPKERKDVRVFETLLQESLPKATNLVNLKEAELDKALDAFVMKNKNSIDYPTWLLILPKLRSALLSTVSFQHIRRSDRWEVLYESENARLMLTITATEARWDLYANVSKEPLNSPVGKYLREFPIAQMFCQGSDDLTEGSFKLWAPKVHEFKAALLMSGPMVPTYENQVGIVSKQDAYQYTRVSLNVHNYRPELFSEEIRGSYKLSTVCGQPFNSLFVHQESKKTEKRLFMYLEHHLRHGAMDTHSVVLADNARRLEHGEHRATLAKFSANFRFPCAKANRRVDQSIISFTLGNGGDCDPESVYEAVNTTISIDGTWEPFLGICLKQNGNDATKYRHLPTGVSFSNAHCDMPYTVFTCNANMIAGMMHNFPQDTDIPLRKSDEPSFLQDLKYLVQGGLVQKGHKEGGEWKTILNHTSQTRCLSCAPQPPSLVWEKKQIRRTTAKLTPFEDPVEAALYERACKSRADPISASYLRKENNDVEIRIKCDPVGLSHRALAALMAALKSQHPISTQWRLITDAHSNPRPKREPFVIPLNQPVANSDELTDCLQLRLRTQQADAVQWAINMEEKPKPWQAISVEEARLDCVGYRLEARAVAETPIRGGLFAFDVGFGKTIAMIALIQQRMEKVKEWACEKPLKGDAFRVKATLILAPSHLLIQWADEIRKFAKLPMKITIIQDACQWNSKAKIRDFMDADIIIMNMSLIDSGPYLRDLANFAGIVELDNQTVGKQNRAKKSWRQMAADSIKAIMPALVGGDQDDFLKCQRAAYDASVDACTQKQAPIPSKRVVGSKYMLNKEASTGNKHSRDEDDNLTQPKKDELTNRERYWKFVATKSLEEWKPVLEMFEFARIIIDEYTYLNGLEDAIETLSSRSRWILSGTPDLATCSSIFKIGRLIGAYVGTDDFGTTTIEHWKKISGDMTRAEDYQNYLTRKSDAYSLMQTQRAQEFLNMFSRMDKPDLDNISIREHYRIMHLTLYQWAIYKESEQRVTNMDFDHKVHFNSVGGHSSQIFQESARGCDDAREILLYRSTHTQPLPGIESPAKPKVYTKEEQAKRNRLFREKRAMRQQDALDQGFTMPEDDISDVSDVEVTEEDPEWVPPPDNPETAEVVTANKRKRGKNIETTVGPKQIPTAVEAETMCKIVLEFRKVELVALLKNFIFQLRKATWLQNNQEDLTDPKGKHELSFLRWKARAVERQDPEVVTYLKSLIAKATTYHDDDWYRFYRRSDATVRGAAAKRDNKLLPVLPVGNVLSGNNTHLTQKAAALRTLVALLTRLIESLSSQVTSIRFMNTLCCVIDDGVMDCSHCNTQLSISQDFTLLTSCGHAICDNCKALRARSCPGCQAPYQPHQAIMGDQLQKFNKSPRGDVDTSSSKYGKKLDCCMHLIKTVSEEDHVLLFVQFDLIHNEVAKALDANGIEYVDLKKARQKDRTLTAYEKGQTSAKVLLLNIDDASAAGSNLVIANHIIFLTPYFVKGSNSQEKWNATMTQAIGRCRRWGQEKPVHVYHFVTAETIDVDIIQMRKQKKLILTGLDKTEGQLVELDDSAEAKGPLSSSISHILFRRNY